MTDAEYLDWFNREFWHTLHGPGVGSLSRLQRDALCVMNFQAELNNGKTGKGDILLFHMKK